MPLVGGLLLALASRREELYRFLVREDSVLEWAQVLAYGVTVGVGIIGGPRLWRSGDRLAAGVVVSLAAVALIGAGEELSWGQRAFRFGTPDLFAQNQQGEATLHNDARLEAPVRFAVLAAALCAIVTSIAMHGRSVLAPPRPLIGFFGFVAAYYSFRLLFLPHPTYVQAKYSEWPELCLAFAFAYWSVAVAKGAARDLGAQAVANRYT